MHIKKSQLLLSTVNICLTNFGLPSKDSHWETICLNEHEVQSYTVKGNVYTKANAYVPARIHWIFICMRLCHFV